MHQPEKESIVVIKTTKVNQNISLQVWEKL